MRFVKNFLKRLVPVDDSHLTLTEGVPMQMMTQSNVYMNYKIPTANCFSPLIIKFKKHAPNCHFSIFWSRKEQVPNEDKYDGKQLNPK